jgi:pyrroloquinoline quinone biosynthesis protein B
LARQGSPEVPSLTQSSVAVSADGLRWFLLNVSPDIRQQIQEFPELWPAGDGLRGTGIAGCVLTDAEIDHTSGLLLLREDTLFQIHSTAVVRRWLRKSFPIEPMLSAFRPRPWREIPLDIQVPLVDSEEKASALSVTAIDLPGHAPIYVGPWHESTAGSVVALLIEDRATGGTFLYAPGVAEFTPALEAAAERAQIIFLDGTFWTADEMVKLGLSSRDAAAMGHLPMSGPGGSLEWLRTRSATQKVYIHINNTNPVLNAKSSERKVVESAGVHIGRDGAAFEV